MEKESRDLVGAMLQIIQEVLTIPVILRTVAKRSKP